MPKPIRDKSELSHHRVSVARLLIVGSDGDFKAWKDRMKALAQTVQRVHNDTWCLWQRFHWEAGSPILIREWMAADIAWAKSDPKTRGKRVRCPVSCVDTKMSNRLYHELAKLHPDLNIRCVVLALNKITNKMKSTPASKSAYPRWMRILAGLGEFPSSSRTMPIPFDKDNSGIKGKTNHPFVVPTDENNERWKIKLRVERMPSGNGRPSPSVVDVLHLKTAGWKLRGVRQTLWNLATGKWTFCGSDLLFQESTGEWYVHICYKIPEEAKPEVDRDHKAMLCAGRSRPVWLLLGGKRWDMRREGRDVFHVRRQLAVQRLGRSEAYKNATSAKKGHGRNRALKWREKFTRRWQDFTKTWNNRLVSDLVRRCRDSGTGTLVFYQPSGVQRDRRYLAQAGKIPGREDGTGWDWGQLAAILKRKCQENGIVCEVKDWGKRSFSSGNGKQSRNGKGVTVGTGGDDR